MTAVVLNGFLVGLIYGLLATGLVVVYRGSRVINFAHGEIGMLATFVYLELRLGASGLEDRGLVPSALVAVAIAAAIGALIEVGIVRPLREAPPVRAMVATFAVGALILVFAIDRWGISPRQSLPVVEGEGVRLWGLTISPSQLLILATAIVLCVCLGCLYRFTSFGLQLRATAMDPYAAGLVGVNVNRTSTITWMCAGAIAAISGILVAPLVAVVPFFMTIFMAPVLAAALVGGLTSVAGAFAAGVALGIAQGVLAYQVPVAGITELTLAGFILVLLLVRPTGLVRSAY